MFLIDPKLELEICYLMSGGMAIVSFALLAQSRLAATINTFAVHAGLLGIVVALQADLQAEPNLYLTAAIALMFKATAIPLALHYIIRKLEIHRTVEMVVSPSLTMAAGVGLVVVAVMVMRPVTIRSGALVTADLIFAMVVVLLGILMMITRRNAITQVVGFMSLENGLILAMAGVHGMPLVVEISVALTVLVACIVFGMFFFRIRERFASLDIRHLEADDRIAP